MIPKKAEYADCFQGLIQLILMENDRKPEFVNIDSWGFCYMPEEGRFDIPKKDMEQTLYRYYGMRCTHYRNRSYKEYVEIIQTCMANRRPLLLKVNVSSCAWNKMAKGSGMSHFLLITEFNEEKGEAVCVDAFYPDAYHDYDMKKNIKHCIKLVEVALGDKIRWDKERIKKDIVTNLKGTLEAKPTPTESLREFANGRLLEDVLTGDDLVDYDEHQMACKRLARVRKDLWTLIQDVTPKEDGEALEGLWEEVVQYWNRFHHYLIKKQVSPTLGARLLGKSRELFMRMADVEREAVIQTIERLDSHKWNCNINQFIL